MSYLILSLWVVVLRDYGTYADLDGAGLRFLRCSPWECLEERCSRFDAFDCSSTLVSRLTRFQVSCEDSSPSSPHLSDERLVGESTGFRDVEIKRFKTTKVPITTGLSLKKSLRVVLSDT